LTVAGPLQVAIVVYDGFDDLDAIGPYEVLQAAGTAKDWRQTFKSCRIVEEERPTVRVADDCGRGTWIPAAAPPARRSQRHPSRLNETARAIRARTRDLAVVSDRRSGR
jgi:hypothetical protein